MEKNNPRTPLIEKGWLRAVIICLTLFLASWTIGTVSAMAMLATGNGKTAEDLETVNLLSLLIYVIVSAALAIVFRLFIDRQPISSLGFHPEHNRNDAWVGLLLSMVLLGTGCLALYFAGSLSWIDTNFSGPSFFIATVFMLMVAVSEEMVFRGYVLNNLMESFNKWTALLISALLFTFAHLFNPQLTPLAIINLFLGGVLLGINFIYTRTLWFAIGFHFGWNLLQGYVLGFPVSGFSDDTMLQQELRGPAIMTGGTFGFEGSIVATVVLIAAIGLFYYVYEKKQV